MDFNNNLIYINSKDDFEKYRGKLKGKIVMYMPPRENINKHWSRLAMRYSKEDLDAIAKYPVQPGSNNYSIYTRGFLDEMEGERFSNNKANVEKYGFNYASIEEIGEMLQKADLVIPF